MNLCFLREKKVIIKFIKIDVEGYEYKALVGLKNILYNDSPIVAIEQWTDQFYEMPESRHKDGRFNVKDPSYSKKSIPNKVEEMKNERKQLLQYINEEGNFDKKKVMINDLQTLERRIDENENIKTTPSIDFLKKNNYNFFYEPLFFKRKKGNNKIIRALNKIIFFLQIIFKSNKINLCKLKKIEKFELRPYAMIIASKTDLL